MRKLPSIHPILEVRGTPRSCGRQYGESQAEAIEALLLGLGGVSLARTAPAAELAADFQRAARRASALGTCWVNPEKTQGPYYFDPALARQDIRETKTGVLLDLAITVIDANCDPRPGVMVDVERSRSHQVSPPDRDAP